MKTCLRYKGGGNGIAISIVANSQIFNQPTTHEELSEIIDRLGIARRYIPLTVSLRNAFHTWYNIMLNGFDKEVHRRATIDGVLICSDYTRIVVGDYGAYLECTPEQLLVALTVPEKQQWRLDKNFLSSKNINIKYEWYEYQGVKVYLQCNTVKYADYQPGFYYISVLAFDKE